MSNIWRRIPTGRIATSSLIPGWGAPVGVALGVGFFENPETNTNATTVQNVKTSGSTTQLSPIVGNSPDLSLAPDPALYADADLSYWDVSKATSTPVYGEPPNYLVSAIVESIPNHLGDFGQERHRIHVGYGMKLIPDGPWGTPAIRYMPITGPGRDLSDNAEYAYSIPDFGAGNNNCIEFFIRTTFNRLAYLFGCHAGAWTPPLGGLRLNGDSLEIGPIDGAATLAVTLPSVLDGEWHHLVIDSTATSLRILFDGGLLSDTADSGYGQTRLAGYGGRPDLTFWGDIAELRIVKVGSPYLGTTYSVPNRYYSDIQLTPSICMVAEGAGHVGDFDPHWDNVSLLLPLDSKVGNTLVYIDVSHDLQVSAPDAPSGDIWVWKFPAASGSFFQGEYLKVEHDPLLDLSSGAWTVSIYFQSPTPNANRYLIDKDGTVSTDAQYSMWVGSDAKLHASVGDGTTIGTIATLVSTATVCHVTETWHEAELSCDGSTVYLFVDGVLQATAAKPTMADGGKPLLIGIRTDATLPTSSDFIRKQYVRVTKGVCRHISGYTPQGATPPPRHGPPTSYLTGATALENFTQVGIATGEFPHGENTTEEFTQTSVGVVPIEGVSAAEVSVSSVGIGVVPPIPIEDLHWSSVSLLLPFEEANGSTTTVDISPNPHTVTMLGSAHVTTTDSGMQAGSLALVEGTSDGLSIPLSSAFNFSGGAFTIELYAKLTDVGVAFLLDFCNEEFSRGWELYLTTQERVGFFYYAGGVGYSISTTTVFTGAGWKHISVSYTPGSKVRIHINGVMEGESQYSHSYIDSMTDGALYVGVKTNPYTSATVGLTGFLDGVRITKGVNRYPNGTTFTPPTIYGTFAAQPTGSGANTVANVTRTGAGTVAIAGVGGNEIDFTSNGTGSYPRIGDGGNTTLPFTGDGAGLVMYPYYGDGANTVSVAAYGSGITRTNINDLILYLPYDSWVDASMYRHRFSISPGAKLSHARSKFGSASITFTGFEDSAQVPLNPRNGAYDDGSKYRYVSSPTFSQNQTHSFFLYVPTLASNNSGRLFGVNFYGGINNASSKDDWLGWQIEFASGGRIQLRRVSWFWMVSGFQETLNTTVATIPKEQWVHVTVSYNAGNNRLRIFFDGVNVLSEYLTWPDQFQFANQDDSSVFSFGADSPDLALRVYQGAANVFVDDYQWSVTPITSDFPFTPPTATRVLNDIYAPIDGEGSASLGVVTSGGLASVLVSGDAASVVIGAVASVGSGVALGVGVAPWVGSNTIVSFSQVATGQLRITADSPDRIWRRTGLLVRHDSKGVNNKAISDGRYSYGHHDESPRPKGNENEDWSGDWVPNPDTPFGIGSSVSTISPRVYEMVDPQDLETGPFYYEHDLRFRSGTAEVWLKVDDDYGVTTIFEWDEYTFVKHDNATGVVSMAIGVLYQTISTGPECIPRGVWSHIALTIVRTAGTGKHTLNLFVNGIKVLSGQHHRECVYDLPIDADQNLDSKRTDRTFNGFYYTYDTTISLPVTGPGGYNYKTLQDEFRWVWQEILYTENFTPPTQPLYVRPPDVSTTQTPVPVDNGIVVTVSRGYGTVKSKVTGAGRVFYVSEITSETQGIPPAGGRGSVTLDAFISAGEGTARFVSQQGASAFAVAYATATLQVISFVQLATSAVAVATATADLLNVPYNPLVELSAAPEAQATLTANVVTSVEIKTLSNASYDRAVKASLPVLYFRLGDASGTQPKNEVGALGAIQDDTLIQSTTGGPTFGGGYASFVPSATDAPAVDTGHVADYSVATIETWVRAAGTQTEANALIFGKRRDPIAGMDSFPLGLYADGGTAKLWIANGVDTTVNQGPADFPLPTGVWTHVVATFTAGGACAIYTNGVLDYSWTTTNTPPASPTLPWTIGSGYNSTGYNVTTFFGDISEVSLYDRVLSASEIGAHYQSKDAEYVGAVATITAALTVEDGVGYANLSASMVATSTFSPATPASLAELSNSYGDSYWDKVALLLTMETHTAQYLDDLSSRTKFAALFYGTVDTTYRKYGSNSLKFGTSAYAQLRIDNHPDFNLAGGDFCIDMMVHIVSTGPLGGILLGKMYSPTVSNNYSITVSPSRQVGFSVNNAVLIAPTVATTLPYAFAHVAVTRQGSLFTLYIDGVSVGSATYAGSITNTSLPELHIGSWGIELDSWIVGWLDEIRITNGAARWYDDFAVPTATSGLSPVNLAYASPSLTADLFVPKIHTLACSALARARVVAGLVLPRPLAAEMVVSPALSPGMRNSYGLQAQIQCVASSSSSITKATSLSATSSAQPLVQSAALTVSHPLAASAQAVAVASSSMALRVTPAPSGMAVVASVSATLTLGIQLSANAVARSSTSIGIWYENELAATATTEATGTGTLLVTVRLASAAVAVSTASATALRTANLACVNDSWARASITATLAVGKAMSSAAVATASLPTDLRLHKYLESHAESLKSISNANLRVGRELSTAAICRAYSLASLFVRLPSRVDISQQTYYTNLDHRGTLPVATHTGHYRGTVSLVTPAAE